MITSSLITSLLVLSLSTDTESLERLRAEYGSVRGTLEDYSSALLGRADPSPILPATHLALSAGIIVGLSTENRELSKTVVLSESASALASLTQLGIGLWMPASDLKLGALKFSEFYAWGFQAVGQFFYGRQLMEAGLNNEDALVGRRLEERGDLHQNLSWMTALWGFQSTFLRSWTRYAELQSELKRLDETPEPSTPPHELDDAARPRVDPTPFFAKLGADEQARHTSTVGALLEDSDQNVRAAAARFLQRLPDANAGMGSAGVADLRRRHRQEDGVADDPTRCLSFDVGEYQQV